MLKNRLICCLILQNELLVQSIGFKKYLPIGKAKIAVEFMTDWDIDEIIILDITASREGRKPNLNLIATASQKCFVPITVGGGISTLEDIHGVIRAGADKISINNIALKTPKFITEAAESYGTQCVVVSIDVKRNSFGKYEVYADSGLRATGLDPIEWAQKCEELGAGEIFLNSIDRDGAKQGYDIELIKQVSDKVKIPVIACGGVGNMNHFVEGITRGGASAVAAANIFQHIEHSPIVAKSFLSKAGIAVRLDEHAHYTAFVFDDSGRILKRDDKVLEDLWLEKFKVNNL